jgi:hypothetical protein
VPAGVGPDGAGGPGQGGAVDVAAGSATLTNATLSQDAALGATVVNESALGGGARGGAVCITGGTVTLNHSTLSLDTAEAGSGDLEIPNHGFGQGGAVYVAAGTVALNNSTLSQDVAQTDNIDAAATFAAYGGGLCVVGGTVTLSNSTLANNAATSRLAGANGTGFALSFGGGLCNGSQPSDGFGAGTVTLTDCTVSDNSAHEDGGGLYNSGTLTLTGCTVSGNSAVDDGGGLLSVFGVTATLNNCTITGNSAGTQGGGLEIDGTAMLTGCTVSGNSAGSDGGGLFLGATATLTHCTITGNSASLTLFGNSAATSADTPALPAGSYQFQASYGGDSHYAGSTSAVEPLNVGPGSSNTQTEIEDANFFGVAASGAPGEPVFDSMTVSGSPFTPTGTVTYTFTGPQLANLTPPKDWTLVNPTIWTDTATLSPNSSFGPVTIQGGGLVIGGTATLTDCTISGNSASAALSNGSNLGVIVDGGGLTNLGTATLSNCTISGNSVSATLSNVTNDRPSAVAGGGLSNGGTATLTNCTLSDNSATPTATFGTTFGGGLSDGRFFFFGSTLSVAPGKATLTDCTLSGNSATDGGGVYVNNSNRTIENLVMLTSCAVSGNSAGNEGGGLYIAAGLFGDGGTATLTNCTFSGNSAPFGAGLFLQPGVVGRDGSATLTNCTVAANSGVGLWVIDNATATLNNTVVAGNTGGDLQDTPFRTGISGNNNLIGDGSGALVTGSGNLLGVDPKLAPLGNYGGPTQTMALLPGSPAIDAGSNALVPTGVSTDQRGYQRISGAAVDVGAFEVTVADRSVVTASAASVPFGGTATITLQAEDNLGNKLTAGGLNVAFGLGAGTSGGSLGPVTDNGNGTYTATFTATAVGTARTLTATINGMAVTTPLPTVTVTKATPALTWGNPPDVTYGTPLGAAQLDATSNVPGTFAYSPAAGTVLGAGAHTLSVTFTPSDTADYNNASQSVTLVVDKATLTVTADDAARNYGVANPTFTASYSGFVNGETLATSGVTGSPSLTTTATLTSPPGPYPITAALGTLAAANYAFFFVNGTLTVRPGLPAVQSVQVNDGSAQRSMVTSLTLTFAAPLGAVPPGSIVINSASGALVPTAFVVAGNQLTVRFTGLAGVIGGSLPDGRYSLAVGGQTVATFFRLFGDVNGDGQVDDSDRAAFLAAYRSRSGMANYRSYFDYNGDGLIDSTDYYQFLRRYGTQLAP